MTTTDDAEQVTATREPEHQTPDAGAPRWWDAAIGTVFETEEAMAGLVAAGRRAVARHDRRVAGLAKRGAVERARGRRRAEEAIQATATAVATAVATSPLLDRIVDAQLERVLRPVVLAVLDDVLLLLEQDPERIQSLIRGQRDSMADELVARIRTGAAAGDTAVDRFTFRILHGASQPVAAPPSPDGP
jgi:hypothetical protein